MKTARHAIHWQLAFYAGIPMASVLLGFLWVDSVRQKDLLVNTRANQMVQELRMLGMALRKLDSDDDREAFMDSYCSVMRFHGMPGHALAALSSDGTRLSTGTESAAAPLSDERMRAFLTQGETPEHWVAGKPGASVLIAALPLRWDDVGERAVVCYSEPLDDIEALSRAHFIRRAGLMAGFFVLTVLLVWRVVLAKVTRPLRSLLFQEYALSKGNFPHTPFQDPHNEISDLQEMFRLMQDQIERRENAMKAEVESRDGLHSGTPVSMARRLAQDSFHICDQVGMLEEVCGSLSEKTRQLLDRAAEKAGDLRLAAVELRKSVETKPKA